MTTQQIIFNPETYLQETKKGFKFKLYGGDLSNSLRTFLKKTGFSSSEFKAIDNLVQEYQERIEDYNQRNPKAPIKQVLNDYKQADQLVDNILIYNKVKDLKKEYKSNKFIWLPSNSKDPRHSHMLYYGKTFDMQRGADGKGLLPGTEFGCKCGLRILLEK